MTTRMPPRGRAVLLAALLPLACGDDGGALVGGAPTSGGADSGPGPTGSGPSSGTVSDGTASDGVVPDGTTGDPPAEVDYAARGPYPVGHVRVVIDDATATRVLPVEIWYPADASAVDAASAGQPLADLVPDEPNHAQLAQLVADAPETCTRKQTESASDVPPRDAAPYPLVVFSHCHQCTRFSSLSVAEHLASHGFAVAAPDHTDNTLFDGLAGTGQGVTAEFLAVRATDIGRVLDVLLDPNAPELPAALRGRFDADRIGMFGHSFGSVTTGRVLQDDDRVRAGVAIAAPVQSPLLPGVALDQIDEPLLMLLATEDNSIQEIGNNLIRSNFRDATPPVWLVEFADAGHWSFSDLCGLIPDFDPGCGEGQRQTRPGTAFTYLDNAVARATTATWTTRFFAAQLLGDLGADAALDVADPDGVVTVSVRRD